MSAIYFHSEYDTAELRGSERAYMGVLCSNLMLGTIGDYKDWLLPFLPSNSWALRDNKVSTADINLYLWSMDGSLLVDKDQVDTFTLSLNTAILIGSDPIILLARLHGQCELHCWVAGPNRKWLANIIKEGRKTNIYRENQGWEEVVKLLKSRTDSPIVCSFSVCDSFPNYSCLPKKHPLKQSHNERRFDQFNDLPENEMWSECFQGLQEQGGGLELKPENWRSFYFGVGHNIFTLLRMAHK